MRSKILLILGLLSTYGFGQEFLAAPYQGMGNSGLAVPSVYSLSLNASTINQLNNPVLALAYQPHFLSSSIQSHGVYVALPFRSNNATAFGISSYGLKGTSSLMTVRGGYSRNFGGILSSSVTTNYHQYQVKKYGIDRAFSMDLGLHYVINPALSVGAFFRNISAAKFDDTLDQNIPQESGVGMAYQLSKEVLIVTDFFYNQIKKIDPRFGISYHIDELLIVRLGVAAKPIQYCAGIGVCLGKLRFDISSSFNVHVGYAPQLALAYDF